MNDIQLPETETPRPAGPPGNAVVHNRLRYHGTAGDFAKIALTNAIASIATLGIYRFWGKTRERRYLWGGIEFLGDRVEYTGIGRELFLGFLVALAVLGLLLGMAYGIPLVFGDALWVQWLVQFGYTFVLIVLIYVAEYRARRYRLSRTQWRGIRFAQDGSSLRYALLALGWGIVVILSLGVGICRLSHARAALSDTTHTSFGDRRFAFDARAMELLKPWLAGVGPVAAEPWVCRMSGTGSRSSGTSPRGAAAARPCSAPTCGPLPSSCTSARISQAFCASLPVCSQSSSR